LFWLWLTPVFYSTAMIPPEYQILFVLNPMTVYVALYRFALLGSDYAGTGGALFAAIMLAAAVFLAGHVLFRKGEPDFLKRV